MKKIFIVFLGLFALAALSAAEAQTQDSCLDCHRAIGSGPFFAPAEAMKEDVHAKFGISCADCHGGDPKDSGFTSMDRSKGFIGVPKKVNIPGLCSRCHSNTSYIRRFNPNLPTDQLAKYRTSTHGRLNEKGDDKVAVCTSCHRAHSILPPDDTRSPVNVFNVPETCGKCHADANYMAGYNIPTDQLEKYKSGVHGQMLLVKHDSGAPSCASCHGSHDAAPPKIVQIASVCGKCHAIEAELFIQSPHKAAYDAAEIPECVACHNNHRNERTSDNMLGVGGESLCINCHFSADSKGYQAAQAIGASVDELKAKMAEADLLIVRAERAGMEVGEGRFSLVDADHALVQIRAVIHSVSPDQVGKLAGDGIKLAAQANEVGKKAWAELQFRRRGLALSLVFILMVVVALFFKIRDVDRRGGG